MANRDMSRRTLLKGGGAALAGLSTLQVAGPASAFPGTPEETVLPWLDQPGPAPLPPEFIQLKWEELDSWLTPNDKFFVIYHGDVPALDPDSYRLAISGLVARPQSLRLADLKQRPRREQIVTLECSGNHGFPFFTGAVSNAQWAGTPLAPLLERAGLRDRASEVSSTAPTPSTLTIRDNPGA